MPHPTPPTISPPSPPPQKVHLPTPEWERRLSEVSVSKNDLNCLILDYLVIEGYQTAAEEFCKEADIQPPSGLDLNDIESRMCIREAVQRGDVEEAIERVNDLNPEILESNPELHFHLQQQRLIEYIRAGKIADALEFAQTELAPRGEDHPEFLSELERTMALLAFEKPPSGIAELLLPAQRMKTAGEVNTAILASAGQGQEAKLRALVRLLCWGEAMLEERCENIPKWKP